MLGGNHRVDWVTTYPFNVLEASARHIKGHPHTRGDVIIGNDVWIGQSCTIMSGVKIGDGACLAAEALIVKDVPPYSIVGGNPARMIRERFNPDQIERLIRIAWWNWDSDKLKKNFALLLSSNIDAFIEAHDSI